MTEVVYYRQYPGTENGRYAPALRGEFRPDMAVKKTNHECGAQYQRLEKALGIEHAKFRQQVKTGTGDQQQKDHGWRRQRSKQCRPVMHARLHG